MPWLPRWPPQTRHSGERGGREGWAGGQGAMPPHRYRRGRLACATSAGADLSAASPPPRTPSQARPRPGAALRLASVQRLSHHPMHAGGGGHAIWRAKGPLPPSLHARGGGAARGGPPPRPPRPRAHARGFPLALPRAAAAGERRAVGACPRRRPALLPTPPAPVARPLPPHAHPSHQPHPPTPTPVHPPTNPPRPPTHSARACRAPRCACTAPRLPRWCHQSCRALGRSLRWMQSLCPTHRLRRWCAGEWGRVGWCLWWGG